MAEEAMVSRLRGEADDRVRAIWLRDETEKILHSAVNITEVATEMSKRTKTGEKTINHLKRLSVDSRRALEALGTTGQEFTNLGAQTASAGLRNLEVFAPDDDVVFNSLKQNYGRLLHTLHYSDSSQEKMIETHPSSLNLEEIRKRITKLEQLQKSSQRGFQHPPSNPSHSRPQNDFDEKYPVLQPRGSLIDLNHITNLQTVPEDAFVSSRQPARSSSLCSLKSMRRLMKTLQRAEVEEGEVGEGGEESKCDKEVEPNRFPSWVSVRLGDITEELQPE